MARISLVVDAEVFSHFLVSFIQHIAIIFWNLRNMKNRSNDDSFTFLSDLENMKN